MSTLEEARAQLAQKETRVAELEATLGAASLLCTELTVEAEESDARTEALLQELEDAKSENARLLALVVEADAQSLASPSPQRSGNGDTSAVRALESRVAVLETQLAQQAADLVAATNGSDVVARLELNQRRLLDEMEEEREAHARELDAVKRALAEAEEELEETEDAKAAVEAEAREALAEITAKASETQTALEVAEAEVTRLQRRLEGEEEARGAWDTGNFDDALLRLLETAEAERDAAARDAEDARQVAADAQSELAIARQELDTERGQLTHVQDRLAAAQFQGAADLRVVEQDYDELRQSIEAKEARIGQLELKLEAYSTIEAAATDGEREDALRHLVSVANAEVRRLEGEMEGIVAQLVETKVRVAQATFDLQLSQQNARRLERQLDRAKRRLKRRGDAPSQPPLSP